VQEPGLLPRLRAAADRNVFLVVVLASCTAVHAHAIRNAVVQDAWYSLLGGRTVLHSGLPHHDTWTIFTLGRRWVDEQWLGHVLLYGLWAAAGWRLVLLAVVALFVAAFLVLAIAARRLGASDRAVALTTALAYATGVENGAMRAQIPAYLLFAIVTALLIRDSRAPSRWVIAVFPLLVLWANIHGSVILGAALVALRGLTVAGAGLVARARPREWAARAVVLVVVPWLCTLVTPYGFDIVHYYRTTIGNSALTQFVTEWGPMTVRAQPQFFALLIVAVWLAGRSRRVLTPFEQLALLGTAVLGLYALRYAIWFALVAVGTVPLALDAAWRPSAGRRREQLNAGLAAAALAVALLALTATFAHGNTWFERDFPAKAADAVAAAARADPKLRIYADERYSDWLMFEDPALEGRVAFDVRFELLTSVQLARLVDYRTELGIDWQRAARGYGLLVLEPDDDRKTIKLLERRPGAKLLFRSTHVVVLRRPT
jgi:hypothetical protein